MSRGTIEYQWEAILDNMTNIHLSIQFFRQAGTFQIKFVTFQTGKQHLNHPMKLATN